MDYNKIYDNIVNGAKSENRQKLKKDSILYSYYEKHHIIPRCMGGTNDKDNLVLLTAREHYICHKLLTYIFKENRKIACAFHLMTYSKNKDYTKSSRNYAYARELISSTAIGIPRSVETKEKISNTMTGRKYSNERSKKSGDAHINIKMSEETCNKKRESMKGKNTGSRSNEVRNKISNTLLNKESRMILIGDKLYKNISDASKSTGIKIDTIYSRLYSNSDKFIDYKRYGK